MKTQTIKKLVPFAALVFSFFILLSNNSCQKEISADTKKIKETLNLNASLISQIIYTDIISDTVLSSSGSLYNLDLNNDGIVDYSILNNYTSIKLSCMGSNEVLLDSILYSPGAALPLSKTIGSNSKIWKDTSGIMTYTVSRRGNCPCFGRGLNSNTIDAGPGPGGCGQCTLYNAIYPWGSTYIRSLEAYLGFKIYKGTNRYYAWAQIRVAVPNPLVNHLTVTIEDYAFNSSSNQSILAGQNK